jgi:hypothetical protein
MKRFYLVTVHIGCRGYNIRIRYRGYNVGTQLSVGWQRPVTILFGHTAYTDDGNNPSLSAILKKNGISPSDR